MSYYTTDRGLVYFGESEGADQWIEKNIEGAKPESAVPLDPTPPTEVHPGVLRYLRREDR